MVVLLLSRASHWCFVGGRTPQVLTSPRVGVDQGTPSPHGRDTHTYKRGSQEEEEEEGEKVVKKVVKKRRHERRGLVLEKEGGARYDDVPWHPLAPLSLLACKKRLQHTASNIMPDPSFILLSSSPMTVCDCATAKAFVGARKKIKIT